MNICLLKTLSKWLEVIFISTVSLFNFGYDSKEEIIENDVINKNDIENYVNYYNNDNCSENAVNKMWGKTEILTNALYKQTILNGSSFINVDNNVWLKDEDTYKVITINNEFTNEEKANMFIVIKLNNNVVITSGEGTQINPYVVED